MIEEGLWLLRSHNPDRLGPRSAASMPRHTTRITGLTVTGTPLNCGAAGSGVRPEMRVRVTIIGPCTGAPAMTDALQHTLTHIRATTEPRQRRDSVRAAAYSPKSARLQPSWPAAKGVQLA